MPIADSNPAANLSFEAAVSRALSRRPADIPHPPRPESQAETPAPDAPAPADERRG
ncbi:MAG: hypothetical protein C0P65_007430 [Lysobacteraceae bacterium]|mgnify:CR=1 FL=1|jgi:hypothetical protein